MKITISKNNYLTTNQMNQNKLKQLAENYIQELEENDHYPAKHKEQIIETVLQELRDRKLVK